MHAGDATQSWYNDTYVTMQHTLRVCESHSLSTLGVVSRLAELVGGSFVQLVFLRQSLDLRTSLPHH